MFTLLFSLHCQLVHFGLFLMFLWYFFAFFGIGQLSAFALVGKKEHYLHQFSSSPGSEQHKAD